MEKSATRCQVPTTDPQEERPSPHRGLALPRRELAWCVEVVGPVSLAAGILHKLSPLPEPVRPEAPTCDRNRPSSPCIGFTSLCETYSKAAGPGIAREWLESRLEVWGKIENVLRLVAVKSNESSLFIIASLCMVGVGEGGRDGCFTPSKQWSNVSRLGRSPG